MGAQVTGTRGGQLAWAYFRTGSLAWSAGDFAAAEERLAQAVQIADGIPAARLAREVGADETQFAAEVHRFHAVILRDLRRFDEAYDELVRARKAFDPSAPSRYGAGYTALKLHSILHETSHIECMRRNRQAAIKALHDAREAALPHPGLAGNARGVATEIANIESGKTYCGA